MLRNRLLLLFSIFQNALTACSTAADPDRLWSNDRQFTSVHDAIAPYYDEFQADCGWLIWDLPAGFVAPGMLAKAADDRNAVGSCYEIHGPLRTNYEIAIDVGFWDRATYAERKWLIYHELGHCALWRDHVEYESIMAPNIGDIDKLDELIPELCENTQRRQK